MPVNYNNFLNCATEPCTASSLTSVADNCSCTTWSGRVNDLYFVDCSLSISETNLLDTAWWETNLGNGKIVRLGVGIGGYQKKNVTTFDAGGCGAPTVENIEWALSYQVFCVDKSTAFGTHEFADGLIAGALNKYNLVARYCGGDNVILPIGKVALSDVDNILPTSVDEFMSFNFEFSWKHLGVPTPLTVAGLSSVLPKASR